MRTKLIEVTNRADPNNKGINWGKFAVCRFDGEWARPTLVGNSETEPVVGLLHACGWGHEHTWVLDLQTGEGAFYRIGGCATADLEKHKIWVCPMFEPFLTWLYEQPAALAGSIEELPDAVDLDEAKAPSAMYGYRRPGPEAT